MTVLKYKEFVNENLNEAKFSEDDRVRTKGGIDFGDEMFTVIHQKGNKVTVEDDEDETRIFKASELELAESVNESLPSNIKDFAKERGVLPLVNKVNGWAKKLGKRVVGGTAIGKHYGTLILDLTYQGSEVRINTETDEIEVKGKDVNNFNSFKAALGESVNEAAPKMAVDPDAEYVSDVISRLGVIGRSATGSNVQKDITKALKALQNLRSSIQVGR